MKRTGLSGCRYTVYQYKVADTIYLSCMPAFKCLTGDAVLIDYIYYCPKEDSTMIINMERSLRDEKLNIVGFEYFYICEL